MCTATEAKPIGGKKRSVAEKGHCSRNQATEGWIYGHRRVGKKQEYTMKQVEIGVRGVQRAESRKRFAEHSHTIGSGGKVQGRGLGPSKRQTH